LQTKSIKPGTLVGRERRKAREEAIEFFMSLANANIDKICIENPVGVMSSRWRQPDQYIHPYMFGHDASKKTGLWLKGLPVLKPTNNMLPRIVCCNQIVEDGQSCKVCRGAKKPLPRWGNQTNSGQNRLPPSADRWKDRSRTYQGIADAMAEQWG